MIRIAVIAALVLAACQSGKAQKRRDETYANDVEKICNAEKMSGALEEDPNARATLVAVWLGNNLVTPEARDLMVRQAQLPPNDKAALLRAEAREVGLADCPIADTWVPKHE